jgi:hypothetical protein
VADTSCNVPIGGPSLSSTVLDMASSSITAE